MVKEKPPGFALRQEVTSPFAKEPASEQSRLGGYKGGVISEPLQTYG